MLDELRVPDLKKWYAFYLPAWTLCLTPLARCHMQSPDWQHIQLLPWLAASPRSHFQYWHVFFRGPAQAVADASWSRALHQHRVDRRHSTIGRLYHWRRRRSTIHRQLEQRSCRTRLLGCHGDDNEHCDVVQQTRCASARARGLRCHNVSRR